MSSKRINKILELSNTLVMVLGTQNPEQVLNDEKFYQEQSIKGIPTTITELEITFKFGLWENGSLMPNFGFIKAIKELSEERITFKPLDGRPVFMWSGVEVQLPAGRILIKHS